MINPRTTCMQVASRPAGRLGMVSLCLYSGYTCRQWQPTETHPLSTPPPHHPMHLPTSPSSSPIPPTYLPTPPPPPLSLSLPAPLCAPSPHMPTRHTLRSLRQQAQCSSSRLTQSLARLYYSLLHGGAARAAVHRRTARRRLWPVSPPPPPPPPLSGGMSQAHR